MQKVKEAEIITTSPKATLELGRRLGGALKGEEVLELIGDVGSGKTTFTRGLAAGAGSQDQVMSPTFTIMRLYKGNGLSLHHFDFYRLHDPGVIRAELAESLKDPLAAVVIEWSDIVEDVLPADKLRVSISATDKDVRKFSFASSGLKHHRLVEGLA